MERIKQIDPMLYGFFKDESLELSERIAMALVEFARTCDISFDRNYFPCFEFASKTTRFSFSDSLSYNWNSIPSLIEEHPELADELNVLGQKLKNLEEKKSILRDARYYAKTEHAIWGGGWSVGEDFLLIGFGGDAGALQAIEMGNMTGTMAQDMEAQAQKVLDIMVLLLDGKTVEKRYYVNCKPVAN